MAFKDLKPKEKAFVQQLIFNGFDTEKAFDYAFPEKKDIKTKSAAISRMMNKTSITKAIEEKQQNQEIRFQSEFEQMLSKLFKLADKVEKMPEDIKNYKFLLDVIKEINKMRGNYTIIEQESKASIPIQINFFEDTKKPTILEPTDVEVLPENMPKELPKGDDEDGFDDI